MRVIYCPVPIDSACCWMAGERRRRRWSRRGSTFSSSWSMTADTCAQVGMAGGAFESPQLLAEHAQVGVVGEGRVIPGRLHAGQVGGDVVPLELGLGLAQPPHELPRRIAVLGVFEDRPGFLRP